MITTVFALFALGTGLFAGIKIGSFIAPIDRVGGTEW